MEEERKDQKNSAEELQMEELLKRIEETSEDIRVPASLEPEAVKARLRAERKHVRRTLPMRRLANAAAVVVLVAAMGGVGIYGAQPEDGRNLLHLAQGHKPAESADHSEMQNANNTNNTMAENVRVTPQKKAVVGSYRLASGYKEVLAALENNRFYLYTNCADEGEFVQIEDANFYEPSSTSPKELGEAIQKPTDSANMESAGLDQNSADATDYSKTNLQVDGVDESDFIKNDGSYLYVQSGEEIHIVDIRAEQMKTVATIKPELGMSDRICDMYVDGDRLFLVVQRRETLMEENPWDFGVEEGLYLNRGCSFRIDKDLSTELQTYDISDRSAGKLLGTVSQDGGYYSSRKVGDYIYLFSRKNPRYYQIFPKEYVIFDDEVSVPLEIPETESDGLADAAASLGSEPAGEEPVEGIIPCIGGNLAEPDCIYVQDDAGSQLIISSVNVNAPDTVVDYMVLMNNWAQIYMSTEAIYLYSEDWEWTGNESKSFTDIAKFSYKDGILNGVGAVTVRGTIQDTFAISEGSGILRVLTTEWSENSENRLYLLDENLKEMGSLENIARGEEIYAARYLGNVAYFITYHNTDPLFAVDISDPRSPKMLGQLEITGFSDYLHPYGDGLLLGIGYETDPETSIRLGVKLVMFDISDPVNLKILDTVTLERDSWTIATDYYKGVLADANKNLIGFEAMSWKDDENTMGYQLYSWQDGKFVRLLHELVDTGKCWDDSSIRGLYAGQRFYLLNQWDDTYQLRSYDMEDQFRKLDELVLD